MAVPQPVFGFGHGHFTSASSPPLIMDKVEVNLKNLKRVLEALNRAGLTAKTSELLLILILLDKPSSCSMCSFS